MKTEMARGRENRGGGFTLIEILVVVAIIIILAGIVLAVGTQVKVSAARKATIATLTSLKGAMKDYLDATNPEPQDTTSPNDQTNWVKALRASPLTSKKIDSLKYDTSSGMVNDNFGTGIRYVPYNAGTKKEGYFWSAGPDRTFQGAGSTSSDDIFSTDNQ